MISSDALRNLVNKYQTTELNVRREYVQHLFLSYFYQQSAGDRVYFKGGTALRLLFNSPRFSEDLDFSSCLTGTHSIEEAVLETLVAVERENIQTDLQESKKRVAVIWPSFRSYSVVAQFLCNWRFRSALAERAVRS